MHELYESYVKTHVFRAYFVQSYKWINFTMSACVNYRVFFFQKLCLGLMKNAIFGTM